MESSKLKCVLCKKYPNGDSYKCGNRHVGCHSCVDEKNLSLCRCAQPFNRKKQNPKEKLEKQTKIPCNFKQSGCTWLFGSAQLEDHLEECKFRPYRCIIDELDVKPCNWTGQQHEIEEHLEEDHPELGTCFSYFQEAVRISFIPSKSKAVVKLVDAFSKKFLFYYHSNADSRMLYFMIVYFGRRVEAQQYCYELDIRSPSTHGIPRMKFVQQCVADCEDFDQVMEQESNCIAISFKTIEHYLREEGGTGTFSFRFIVKKTEKDASKVAVREQKTTKKGSKVSSEAERVGRIRYISGSSQDDPPLRVETTDIEYPIF